MRRLLALVLVLAACGSDAAPAPTTVHIDRLGTLANIDAGLLKAGIDIDRACVFNVLTGYTDAELATMDSLLAADGSSEATDDLLADIVDCVPD